MFSFRFKNVCLEAFSLVLPETRVTSAEIEDRLAPLYQKLGIPFGTLEKLSGIRSRYFWDESVTPSQAATTVAEEALEGLPFEREQIGAVLNCSVTRDYFEPATATLVHGNLGLSENTFAMDVTNACIGFMNGVTLLGNLIEAGTVKAGIVVSAENTSRLIDSSMREILNGGELDMERAELIKQLPTFTLGCGAAAFVLCHSSIASKNHRVLGGLGCSATQFNDLCSANGDYYFCQRQDFAPVMFTESSELIASAAKLGGRTWGRASEILGWSRDDVDHIFCHQVGKQVGQAFYDEMGLDYSKEFSVYPELGNLVSVALPSAMIRGIEERNVQEDDKVLLTGFGSGLNSLFLGLQW